MTMQTGKPAPIPITGLARNRRRVRDPDRNVIELHQRG